MNPTINVKIGTFVESDSFGFGRVVGICHNILYVRFSCTGKERIYNITDVGIGVLKVRDLENYVSN